MQPARLGAWVVSHLHCTAIGTVAEPAARRLRDIAADQRSHSCALRALAHFLLTTTHWQETYRYPGFRCSGLSREVRASDRHNRIPRPVAYTLQA